MQEIQYLHRGTVLTKAWRYSLASVKNQVRQLLMSSMMHHWKK